MTSFWERMLIFVELLMVDGSMGLVRLELWWEFNDSVSKFSKFSKLLRESFRRPNSSGKINSESVCEMGDFTRSVDLEEIEDFGRLLGCVVMIALLLLFLLDFRVVIFGDRIFSFDFEEDDDLWSRNGKI